MKREDFIKLVETVDIWDIIIIGGGATGLGIAVDSASRGFKTLLVEQSDFAKGTSSRSTKLVHGGVRYLAQGDVNLVFHALKERGRLLANAPHLVKAQDFIIPCYDWFSVAKYFAGLTLYDLMAGRYSFGKSKFLSKKKVAQLIPGLKTGGLLGGIKYYDGQFDDTRLAINLASTAAENGAALLNYCVVENLLKNTEGNVNGVTVKDIESGKQYTLNSKTVINATGVFVDNVMKMDNPAAKQLVAPSQGVHIVLDKSFLNGDSALMIPETSDGRVLFSVPWHNHLIVGTTDTPIPNNSMEPVATDKEINFILETAGQYLTRKPTEKDILAIFAGLRPLAAPDKDSGSTKEISRDHKIIISKSGLITITGGKWTTYRGMGEDAVNKAITTGKLANTPCKTANLQIHGFVKERSGTHMSVYGSDEQHIKTIIAENPDFNEKIHPAFPYLNAEVIWAVRNEMARTVEDVLARRMRVLFLNANAAISMAPKVATLMAAELNYDKDWENTQVAKFIEVATLYLPRK